jgi:U3 small nucleolar RNA-associated protein 23
MNQDRITTTTNFFRLNFEFHEPYELLLDGNFLKLIVERGQPFVHKLEIILNGKVFAHVTECIIRELQLLGDRFKFVLA